MLDLKSTLLLSCLVIGSGRACAGMAKAQDAATKPSPPAGMTLVERTEPLTWLHTFQVLQYREPDPEDGPLTEEQWVEALSRHNLFIPPDDVRTVLRVASRTLARVKEKQSEALREEIDRIALEGRDQLRRELPPQAWEALRRYVDQKRMWVRPGQQ
jgi:hypothetical protein